MPVGTTEGQQSVCGFCLVHFHLKTDSAPQSRSAHPNFERAIGEYNPLMECRQGCLIWDNGTSDLMAEWS